MAVNNSGVYQSIPRNMESEADYYARLYRQYNDPAMGYGSVSMDWIRKNYPYQGQPAPYDNRSATQIAQEQTGSAPATSGQPSSTAYWRDVNEWWKQGDLRAGGGGLQGLTFRPEDFATYGKPAYELSGSGDSQGPQITPWHSQDNPLYQGSNAWSNYQFEFDGNGTPVALVVKSGDKEGSRYALTKDSAGNFVVSGQPQTMRWNTNDTLGKWGPLLPIAGAGLAAALAPAAAGGSAAGAAGSAGAIGATDGLIAAGSGVGAAGSGVAGGAWGASSVGLESLGLLDGAIAAGGGGAIAGGVGASGLGEAAGAAGTAGASSLPSWLTSAGTFLKNNKDWLGPLLGAVLGETLFKPDKPDTRFADRQMEMSNALFGIGMDELANVRDMLAKYQPMYDQILQGQLQASQDNRNRANDFWNFYDQNVRPVEQKVYQDAMNYDRPSELARREGLVAGTVQGQIDSQRQQALRESARMGLSPERTAQQMTDDSNALALAKAGAINKERADTIDKAIAYRTNAANLGGRNANIALNLGGQANQDAQLGLNTITNQFANRNAAFNSAISPLIAAGNLNSSAANLAMDNYRINDANRQASSGNWSTAIGPILGALSDVNRKEDIQPLEPEQAAMDGLEAIPVASWKYKDGAGDGGRHIGPMAQDVNAQFGKSTAPGGTSIDLVSMSGKHHLAIQGLMKRIEKLERGKGSGDVIDVEAKEQPASIPMLGLERM